MKYDHLKSNIHKTIVIRYTFKITLCNLSVLPKNRSQYNDSIYNLIKYACKLPMMHMIHLSNSCKHLVILTFIKNTIALIYYLIGQNLFYLQVNYLNC